MPQLFNKNRSRSRRAPHRGTAKLDASIQQSQNRHVLSGYPREVPFTSTSEVHDYFNQPDITCLRCGKTYQFLGGTHLFRVHGWTVRQYQDFYCLPYHEGLAGLEYKAMQRAASFEKLDKCRVVGTKELVGRMVRVSSKYKIMQSTERLIEARKHSRSNQYGPYIKLKEDW